MKPQMKRLIQVARTFGSQPVPPDVVRAAFEKFKATGELPEDIRIATLVIERVKRGYELPCRADGSPDWGGMMQSMRTEKPRGEDAFMDGLLNEAVNATGSVQVAARAMLVLLVLRGSDVTTPLYAGRELPEYGSVGMTLLELPECWAVRPYKAQAKRLFRRAERLRETLPNRRDDPRWCEELDRATECFQNYGERPKDDLMLEVILVRGELIALRGNAMGGDVRELMALFDRIARASADDREPLIRQLQEVAAQGLLAPRSEAESQAPPSG